jgi:hypothetical protein
MPVSPGVSSIDRPLQPIRKPRGNPRIPTGVGFGTSHQGQNKRYPVLIHKAHDAPPCRCFWYSPTTTPSRKHLAEFCTLWGGGREGAGWRNTQLSKALLAVVPGSSHCNFVTSAEVPKVIDTFLADPLTNASAGAAADSQAAPPPEKRQQAWIRSRRGRSALAPSDRVRGVAGARHPACLGLEKRIPTALISRVISGWLATLRESLFLRP